MVDSFGGKVYKEIISQENRVYNCYYKYILSASGIVTNTLDIEENQVFCALPVLQYSG